jgi:hypothetical protein
VGQVRVRSLDQQRRGLAVQVESRVPEIQVEFVDGLRIYNGSVVHNDVDLEGAICTLEMRPGGVDNLLRSRDLAEVGTNWQGFDVVLRFKLLGEGCSTRVGS